MYFLQKVFQLRDKANPDLETPFLEHLEDLRIMITRIVLTLVVAMIGCFAFQKKVMDVLRAPVENVWAVKAAEKLPETLSVEAWEEAKMVERAALALTPDQRAEFLSHLSEAQRFNFESVRLVRAATQLTDDARESFLKQATDGDETQITRIQTLIELGASPDGNETSDLRSLSTLKPTESFVLSMKLSLFSGIVVSFPLLLLYVLQFVLPGMHDNEKRMLWPAMAIGFGLFLLGVLFAYFVVLPRALVFFATWDEGLGIGSDWRIGWYISFATQFTLLFGLSFELPVVVMVFVKLGLLSYEMMSRTRSYAVLAIVILAAIITPTSDILTLSLMAVPMYVLYEGCIWLAYFDERKSRRKEQSEATGRIDDPQDDEDPQDEPPASPGDPDEVDDLELTEEGEDEDLGDEFEPWEDDDHFDGDSDSADDDDHRPRD